MENMFGNLTLSDDIVKIAKSPKLLRKLNNNEAKAFYLTLFDELSKQCNIVPAPHIVFGGVSSQAIRKNDYRNPVKDKPCIMLGSKLQSISTLFIACHEFGHIIEHNEEEINPNSKLTQEYKANLERYHVGFLSYGKYYNQPLERDANKFAESVFKQNGLRKPFTYYFEKGLAKIGVFPSIPTPESKFTKTDGIKLTVAGICAAAMVASMGIGFLPGFLVSSLCCAEFAIGPGVKISAKRIAKKDQRKSRKAEKSFSSSPVAQSIELLQKPEISLAQEQTENRPKLPTFFRGSKCCRNTGPQIEKVKK